MKLQHRISQHIHTIDFTPLGLCLRASFWMRLGFHEHGPHVTGSGEHVWERALSQGKLYTDIPLRIICVLALFVTSLLKENILIVTTSLGS